ncbi:hypothetical protein V5N11_003214 [Cardamine amara subsp. amara]|uniref:DUF4283 domain-containing protein n=1 Tax=Cardamine amara subsp. amara TaxID=228776 RepID=A0ABD0ZLH0_CARAN
MVVLLPAVAVHPPGRGSATTELVSGSDAGFQDQLQGSVVGVSQNSVAVHLEESKVLTLEIQRSEAVKSSEGLIAEGSVVEKVPVSVSDGLGVGVSVSEDSAAGVLDAEGSVERDLSSGVAEAGSSGPELLAQRTITGSEVGKSASHGERVKSYLSVATHKRPSLQKHDLSTCLDEGDQVIIVPDEILTDSPPLWEHLIIGKFPESAPHIAKIHVIVNKIWTYGNKSVKIDAYVVNSTTIKFRIRDRVIRERVLRRGMWNIADKPMIVSNYGPIIEEAQPALQRIPMWVELKQVPPSYFSWKGLSFLSSAVGEHKETAPGDRIMQAVR